MKWYYVERSSWDTKSEIREVEVEKETSQSLKINGRIVRKQTEWGIHFPTYEEARVYLEDRAIEDVAYYGKQLKKAEFAVAKLRGMKQG